jgi:disease resistance protein RPM1
VCLICIKMNALLNLRYSTCFARCLVFIDDMQLVNVWKDTVDACPKIGSKSRIVVTTSVRSVTTVCSSGSYVYNMQCLSDDDSKSLFWRRVSSDYQRRSPPYSLQTESESIFSKCGGLPLALTSVAKYLNIKGQNLDSTHFKEVGQNLGKDYLSGTNNAVGVFKGIRRALSQYYDSLPDYDHKSCMLYLSIFPKHHQIKSMTLLRKLMAEGLIANAACKCFDELIDRCIVEPVQMCNNSVVAKRCQVPAVVMEYIIQKSVAKNVVTLIQGNEPVIKRSTEACVRRLSIQCSTKERFDELENKSALRSLTMTKTEPSDDLQACKMLRLLDLEGCTGIDKLKGFIEGLSELQLLKYLNLRKTGISKLPTKIEKLQCLETLDIRDTKVKKLPIQVIMLPKLAYLFGKFQMPDVSKEKEPKKLSDFMKNRSVLHTLAGFVADKRKGPEHDILLARNLKKVKVWFNDAPAENLMRSSPDLERASSSASAPDHQSKNMKKCRPWSGKTGLMSQNHDCAWKKNEERRRNNNDFIKLLSKMRITPLESVSIVSSSEICNDFLGSLEAPCTISSIKLRGKLNRLPDSSTLNELGRIKKLQLFSTGLTIKDLSTLQCLRGLEYLKLVEYNIDRFCNGIFIVEENGFESLKSLCIDSPKVPNMQFKVGSMKSLTSLYLLCPNSQMPSGTIDGISHLANICEVILHSSMQQAWETAMANGHPNRPCVKRQPEPTANTTT